MDVTLTLAATSPPDCTISPASVTNTEAALMKDEQRMVDQNFTVLCNGFSQHTFTINSEIQPLQSEDTDPDQSNNKLSTNLDIEAVVPVTMNIKPGSDPNSINLDSSGTVAVAVLTTAAGEYGNTFAFDAMKINWSTVRFGLRDAVWNETGGAYEVHNNGHLEDAFELDEVTKDGDLDMVLHFAIKATGIVPGSTEACVLGKWLDDFGKVHTFFGCDAIRITNR